jgi:hypothetical protein
MLLLSALIIGLTGCPRPQNSNSCFQGTAITITSSDLTPPTTGMDVHFPNKPLITVTSTSNPMGSTVVGNDVVTLIAKGTDPQGIKDIQIWVEEIWWTTDPATGVTTQKGPGLLGAAEASNLDNSASGGTGCSERVATVNLDIKQRRKQASSYRIRAWATAVNFGGAQVKTADVTLSWP